MVLVADVSGYTKLTAQLVESSGARRGAETIARHLESTYERLIAVVHAAGGSVVGFAGDAIHCWFEDDASEAALSAALGLVRVRLPSAELAVKVGLGCGAVVRLALLDAYHIELITGEAVGQASRAEKLASAGEVIVPARLVEKHAAAITARTLDGAPEWARLVAAPLLRSTETERATEREADDAPLPESLVRKWVLPPVWEAAKTSTARPFSELRLGVPLFVEFTELPADEDPRARLLALAASVEEVVLGAGGYVLDAQGGANHLTLYASFGAPVSHEDNPERALRAALELTRRTYSDGVRARAALSLGRVRSGRLGSRERRVDAVVGRDVNLAARLLGQTAPGAVTASPALARAVRGRFTLESLGERALRGIDAPVEAFAVSALAGEQSNQTAPSARLDVGFFGREAELRQLRSEARDHLLGGSGGLIWISGAPGIGKTRLLRELTTELAHPKIAEMRLGSAGAHTPYGAVKPLLAQLFPDALDPGELERRLGELAPLGPLLAPFVRSLTGSFTRQGHAALDDLSDEVRADNTRRALRRFIASAVRETRTALVVEDLHWIDTSTAALLQELLRSEPDLLVLGSSRELPDAAWSSLVKRNIELKELSAAAVQALLPRLLGQRRVDSTLAQFVTERAQGHPLYTEELVRDLVERDCLDLTSDPVAPKNPAELAKLEIPATVEGVLIGRIDRLGAEQAYGLRVLSVLGHRVSERALGAAVRDLGWLPERIVELEALGLLERQGSELVFRHALLRDVAYGALDSKTRARFHELAARAEEAVYLASGAPEQLTAAAHHFTSAFRDGRTTSDVRRSAAHLSALSAEHASHAAAYREAVRSYGDALEIGGVDDEKAIEWQLELAESYRDWGKFAEARRELDVLLQQMGEGTERAVLGLLREIGRQSLHRLSAEFYERDRTDAERRSLVIAGRAHNMLSELAYFGDEKTLSLYAAVRTLNVLEAAGPSPHLALAFGAMGLLSGLFGLGGAAEAYGKEAYRIASSTGQPHEVADVLRIRALGHLGAGRFREAEQDLAETEANHRATHDLRHLGDVITMRAMIAVFEERYDDALQQFAELDRCVDESDSALHRLWSAVWSGTCLSALGQLEEAERLLRAAVPMAKAVGDRQALLGARGQLGHLLVRTGRHAEAELELAEVETTLTATKGMPNGTAEYIGYAGLFEARLALLVERPSTENRERFVRAARYWDGFVRLFPFAEPYRRLGRALAATHAGENAKAQKEIARGLSSAERFSVPSLRARLEEARAL